MSNIAILSDSLVNKIAAGEVIERPASIVRELVDNAIDAGAGAIVVEVLYGGKKLIRVTDNGEGMDRGDASRCLERHSTSKIRTEDDLFRLRTLGFRGEALASIASISKITLVTSVRDAPSATRVDITTNQEQVISDAPPSSGTVIEVRDVFYNTPARRKFLKSIPTELSHIIAVITQKALPYPEVAFTLRSHEHAIIDVPVAGDVRERFLQLYGGETHSEFLEVNHPDTPPRAEDSVHEKTKDASPHGDRGIRVYGFSSAPRFTRAGRSHQFIFVNRRPVKNPTVSHAVYSAYREMIPKDRHPSFSLLIDIDPTNVDVNVHPAKREVRFEFPDQIHRAVEYAIRRVLASEKTVEGALGSPPGPPGYPACGSPDSRMHGGHTVRESLESALDLASGTTDVRCEAPPPRGSQGAFFAGESTLPVQNFLRLGESFVAGVTEDGFVIFDQHAAHERVLYEKLLGKTRINTENLLIPIKLELPVRERTAILNQGELLRAFGFDVGDFGGGSVIVRALPEAFQRSDVRGILLDVAGDLLEAEKIGVKDERRKRELLRKVAARMACHRSVRGSESLKDEELMRLLSDLEKTGAPDRCPHGRPTRVFLSLEELKKMFKRR